MKKRFGPALFVVALGFVVFAVWDVVRRWESGSFELDIGLAIASFVPVFVGSFVQGYGWIALIGRMSDRSRESRPIPKTLALGLYLDSQLARYTPAKVGLPVVRMAGAGRIGVPAVMVGSSVLIEMLSWTAVGTLAGFGLLVSTSRHAVGALAVLGTWGIPALAASFVGLAFLLVLDRRKLPAPLTRLLRLDGEGPLLPPALPLIQLAYWATWAVHGVLASLAVGADGQGALATSGLYVIATVAGFVALVAPAGAGVREAMLAVGLGPTLGAPAAVAAAVVSRAASIAADLLAWGIVRGLVRRRAAPTP